MRVDKELYGDVFRRSPKLTPLEARAIRLAIEYVGPTIAAEAHTPLERVRRKLEETFGQFELAQTPAPLVGDAEEELVRTLSEAVEKRRVVEIEYLKEGDETPTTRSSSRTRSSASCPSGASTRGIARPTGLAPTGSTGCARRG